MFWLLRACWQWCANGCNNSQQCWDLQCIVGRIPPISLCKPCVISVRGPNNVGRAVQTDPTLLRSASAITEQKKCWGFLAEKFYWFQTLRNNTQQHPTTCNRVCKRTQLVTSNNVGRCWSTMLRPFAQSLSHQKSENPRNLARQHVLTKIVQAPMPMLISQWKPTPHLLSQNRTKLRKSAPGSDSGHWRSLVGHLFQKIMTRYTCGFFPRILAIISATRYTCFFLPRILAFFPACGVFTPKYMTIFLQTRIYMRTKKAHIYICVTNTHVYEGSQKVVV